MKRSFRTLVVAVLITTPLLASCGDATDPTSPPQAVQRQDGLVDGLLGVVGGVLDLLGNILSGPDANGAEASAWIGPQGGTVKTAAYTLVVPQGAVSQSTRFEVEPTNTGAYILDLHASVRGLLGTVDVSSKGFLKPVTLKISYANAKGTFDPRKLVIIYITPRGVPEVQPSSIDLKSKAVTSQLRHFSKYAMAQN